MAKSAGWLQQLKGTLLLRFVSALSLTVGIFTTAFAATHMLRHFFADPTVAQYVEFLRGEAEIVPAGKLKFEETAFSCGHRPTVLNARLDDYAAAYYGFLIINPVRFATLPAVIKRYAYAHECGHQYMGRSELAADCYAVKRGRRDGWLDERGLQQICSFISQAKGDAAHPAGMRRCQHMRQCFEEMARLPAGL